jgi:basic amino acid/polyamine antiporter, APA family
MIKNYKHEHIKLKKDISLFDATLAGVGLIVGAGIYVLIGSAAGFAGNGIWISFLIAAFVAILTGFSYAELSSIYEDDSGEYSYIYHTFGKKLAFIIGFIVLLAGIIGTSAVALGFAGYFNSLFGFNNLIITAISIVILFLLINLNGIKKSMKINELFTLLSILGLVFIIALAIPKFGSVNYFDYTSIKGIFKASSLIFFAYLGFDSIIQLSEETKNAKKNIPKALLMSIVISTIIYILVAFACISVINWQVLSASSSPLSDVANALLGSKAGLFLTIIALLSTSNTILLGLISRSRMIYGMSKHYTKLNFLSKVNHKTNVPVFAVIFTASLIIIFTLIGNIDTVASITNFGVFITFASINLAVIKSRYIKHSKEKFHEPINFGKFPVLALIGFLSSIFMIFNIDINSIIYGIILIIVAFILEKIVNK